jgi:hypothetical protein
MELAIINGTYRDNSKIQQQKINQILIPGNHVGNGGLRSPSSSLGQPLIISPRLTQNQVNQNQAILNGAGQFITSSDPTGGLIYTTIPTIPTLYSDATAFNTSQAIIDYHQGGLDFSQAGKIYLYDYNYRKNVLCV